MVVLILGLVIFLASHSVRIFAPAWRRSMIARLGEGPWKGLYSLVSLIALILIVWGYGLSRLDPVVVWEPPVWTRHIAILLNLIAFILLALFIVPSGRLKARLGHPMILGVKVWAFAHLLANGTLTDVLLFGSLLVWAIVDYAASRRRDRAEGKVYVAGPARNDVLAVVLGVVLWAALLWRVHQWVIGVHPIA
ncbi:MAG TPA: NnrU family protein [Propylenella sp.]|nr:NnrU family protein [Propylenella sp.]